MNGARTAPGARARPRTAAPRRHHATTHGRSLAVSLRLAVFCAASEWVFGWGGVTRGKDVESQAARVGCRVWSSPECLGMLTGMPWPSLGVGPPALSSYR